MEVYEEFSQIDTCCLYLTEISSANNLKAVKSHSSLALFKLVTTKADK